MQFQVPQFIEVEDKIFGPLTFRQFIYIAGALGGSYIFWRVLPIYFAIPVIALVGGTGAALAFFQYNGRPFIVALEYAFAYFVHPKLYLWNNEKSPSTTIMKAPTMPNAQKNQPFVPSLSDSRLHNLAWSLDIQERIAAGTANEEERTHHELPRDVMSPMTTAKNAMR
jgi:hypothetical protein